MLQEGTNFFQKNNFCHLQNFNNLITFDRKEEAKFKTYWNRLVLDEKFVNYTHRERRILRYYYTYGKPLILNHDNEYKSSVIYEIDYKQGGNELTYVEDGFIQDRLLQQILATDIRFFESQLDKKCTYAIDIHLFRVKAQNGSVNPTTSGVHQDGMDFICMHYIDAENVCPVISKLYKNKESEAPILSRVMSLFLEALVVNDKILYHSASEVKQKMRNKIAFRDLLLVTFHALEK